MWFSFIYKLVDLPKWRNEQFLRICRFYKTGTVELLCGITFLNCITQKKHMPFFSKDLSQTCTFTRKGRHRSCFPFEFLEISQTSLTENKLNNTSRKFLVVAVALLFILLTETWHKAINDKATRSWFFLLFNTQQAWKKPGNVSRQTKRKWSLCKAIINYLKIKILVPTVFRSSGLEQWHS